MGIFSCLILTTLKHHFMVYQGKVLEPLGAITLGSQFLEPDGIIYFKL